MAKATIREILGDDLEALQAAGLPADRIVSIAKTKAKYLKELREVSKYAQVDENGNIKEKTFDDVPGYIAEKELHKNDKPKEIKTLNSFKGQSFLDRVDRGVVTSGAELANLAQYAVTGKPNETLTKIIDDSRAMDEAYTASQQDPIRQKEAEKLNEELAKAKGVTQTAKAGAKLLLDKALHPGEWNVGGVVGEMANPVNLIGLGSGAVAGKLGTSVASKVALGAGTGAVTQGAVGGGYEYGVAKSTGKSDEEAQKGAIVGGVAGAAMGGAFGGVAGGFAKSVKPVIKERIKTKTDPVAEAMGNPATEDNQGTAPQQDIRKSKLYDELLDNELMQLDEVESHSEAAKPVIEQVSTQAQTPEQINAMIAQYAPPSPKEESFSLIVNDGKPVSPRFAGTRIRDALAKSIENPARTPEEMYAVLTSEGVAPDHAGAIVQSYSNRDLTLYDNYVSDKLSDIIDTEVVEKTKQLENQDDRIRTQSQDGEGDATAAKSGNGADTPATRTNDGANAKQAALQRGERGSGKTVRDDGQNTGEGGQTAGLLPENAAVDGHQTAGRNRATLPGDRKEQVVPDEDAAHTGSGLTEGEQRLKERIDKIKNEISIFEERKKSQPQHNDVWDQELGKLREQLQAYEKSPGGQDLSQKLTQLQQHPKFEEHLKNRENVKASEIKYENKQATKGTLTKEGDYIPPTFEKNWLSDFELTQSDVKKIREGKADEETLQKLEDDLYRYDNDPTYYDHEGKVEDAFAKLPDEEEISFKDDGSWFEEDAPIPEDLQQRRTAAETATPAKISPVTENDKTSPEITGNRNGGPETKNTISKKNILSNDDSGGNNSYIPKTKGERKAINAKVEEIIKKPVESVTPKERKILKNYTGKGGLESGTKESLTQHYTDTKTIDAIYKALDDAGVKFKTALEPAVGSGNFLKRKKAKWTTVDIDKTNHEVVKRLYPDAEHHHSGYESYKPKEKFDLVISNVPFSEERGAGRLAHRPDVKALHDHFFVKALEDVKDDGVVAFITSKGVMDKTNPKIRKEITSQADVIGAYRLPDSAFKHTHTNVVTDVIFLQKRPKGAKSRMEFANKAFETASKDENGIVMNDYYRKYKDNILGEMKAGIDPMYGKPTYLIKGDADLSKIKINYKPYKHVDDTNVADIKAKTVKKSQKPTISDQKVALLKKIKEKLDPALVEEYKAKYKKHPLKDRGLKAHFKEDMDTLYELGSYFDEKFQPAEIFYKEARYSGSGKIEVTEKSPLKERLIYNEDQKGIIDLGKAKYIKEDLDTILEHGYAYLGDGKVQNDALYYSGNIYKKIDETRAIKDRDVSDQISTLEAVLPAKKTLEQISFKGNEPWLLDNGIKVYKVEKTSKWVKVPGGNGERKVYEWKSEFGDVFDNYLNNRKLISAKDGESETAYKRRLREAHARVNDVLAEIKSRAEAQREEIEAVYNRRYNFYRAPDYSKLEYMIADILAELPKDFRLRETQKKFVIKALYEGKNINAHDVGGGKTFAGIVLGRALKKKGIAKKPLFVVPAKVIKNWQKEILQLYPDAKIINLGNLNKATRTKKLFALSNQNADFVLISQEGFKELKLPAEVESRYATELLHENLRNEDLKGRAKAIQEERVKTYLATLEKANSDKRITLDKLGIDAIIADEARAFKNIGVRSSLARLGLGKPFGLVATKDKITLQSALAYDFRFKTRYISERNNHSNVYMLDATPTPNKPLELFTMLKHLDNNIFDEYNIKTDEDFVNQFLETGSIQTRDGKFKEGITGIKNVFELRSIMDRFIDRISMQEFKEKGYIDIPESKVYRHIIEASDETEIVFNDIHNRLQEAKGDISKRKDVLGIYSNGVTASVDPRLYAKEAITELAYRTPENNKIDKVIELVAAKRKSDKNAGQIIFMDNAGHSAEHLGTNLHQEIKAKLLKRGYKKEEIAIISGQEITNVKTGKEIKASGNRLSDMKQEIVNAYNNGKVKIVIGTTKSAGEGMNIQKHTTDIYHIDLPWTPAEITQRNGRGVRYGNLNKEVNIHYFFTQGSFDDLMFNTITKKKGWNDLIWDAEAKNQLKITDSDSGGLPSPDEIMLAMEKDPVKRKELELRIEHERMEENLTNAQEEEHYQKGRVRGIQSDISSLKKRIEKAKREIKTGEVDTKEMRDLFMKSRKSAAAKKKYEKRLKEVLEARKNMLRMNEGRLKKLETLLERTKKEAQIAKKDRETAQAQLERFENENIDDAGRYKTGLEEC